MYNSTKAQEFLVTFCGKCVPDSHKVRQMQLAPKGGTIAHSNLSFSEIKADSC